VPDKPYTPEQALAVLAATPTRLSALSEGLTAAQLRGAPAPGEWSANEVLAHLRACADVWGGNIVTILTEDGPALRGVDPRKWMQNTNYLDLGFQPSLSAFTAQRAQLLARLEPLPPDGWSRAARVSAWGQVYERTVLHFAERLARHERPHVKQIERIVSAARG
jgi:hypothetical protein